MPKTQTISHVNDMSMKTMLKGSGVLAKLQDVLDESLQAMSNAVVANSSVAHLRILMMDTNVKSVEFIGTCDEFGDYWQSPDIVFKNGEVLHWHDVDYLQEVKGAVGFDGVQVKLHEAISEVYEALKECPIFSHEAKIVITTDGVVTNLGASLETIRHNDKFLSYVANLNSIDV